MMMSNEAPFIDPETGLPAVFGGADAFAEEAFEDAFFEAESTDGPNLEFDFFVG